MSNVTYPVTTLSTQFMQAQAGGLTVVNIGTVIVYIDNKFQTNTTSGRAVNPGATIYWGDRTPLWAVCAGGGSITVSTDITGVFDPNAIAQQLLINGVPPVDSPTLMISDVQVIATGATFTSTILDMRKWQSYYFVNNNSGGSSPGTGRTIQLNWYLDSLATIQLQQETILNVFSTGLLRRMAPVLGPFLRIVFTASTSATSVTENYSIVGSYKQVRIRNYNSSVSTNSGGTFASSSAGDSGVASSTKNSPAINSTTTDFFNSWQGPATISFVLLSLAAAITGQVIWTLFAQEPSGLRTVFTQALTPSNISAISVTTSVTLNLPPAALRLDMGNSTTSTSIQTTASFSMNGM
jgi:hypothetical protein